MNVIVGCAPLSRKSPLVKCRSRASWCVSTLSVSTTTRSGRQRAGRVVERVAAARAQELAERLRVADVLDEERDRQYAPGRARSEPARPPQAGDAERDER